MLKILQTRYEGFLTESPEEKQARLRAQCALYDSKTVSHFLKASWYSVRLGGGENENRRLDGKVLFERLPECYASAQLRASNSFLLRAEGVLPSQVPAEATPKPPPRIATGLTSNDRRKRPSSPGEDTLPATSTSLIPLL
jgi:hypothetical protein